MTWKHHALRFGLMASAMLAFATGASAATVTSTDIPKVVDATSTTSTLTVSGVGAIADIDFAFQATHTLSNEIQLTLTSPQGTAVVLVAGVSMSGVTNGSTTTLDDEAGSALAPGGAPYSGSYRPSNPLSAFDGENPNGTWTLTVADLVGADVFTLSAWSVTIEGASSSDPEKVLSDFGARRGDLIMATMPSSGHRISRLGGARSLSATTLFADIAPSENRYRASFSTSLASLNDVLIRRPALNAPSVGFDASHEPSKVRAGAEATPTADFDSSDKASAQPAVDLWIEAHLTDIESKAYDGSKSDGFFSVAHIGVDRVVAPWLLLGVSASVDHMTEDAKASAAETDSTGFFVGPYATIRLDEGVFLEAQAAVGAARTDFSPTGAYRDSIDSVRWRFNAALVGAFEETLTERDKLWIKPSIAAAYYREDYEEYLSASGSTVNSVSISRGQVSAGPEVAWRRQFETFAIEPYTDAQLVWSFAADNGALTSSEDTGLDGVSGSVKLGVRAISEGGWSVDVNARASGLGADRFDALGGGVQLRIPL